MSQYTQYEVVAPKTPGAQPSVVFTGDTLLSAREYSAVRFVYRRDLRMQDVVIRRTRDGKQIETAGPCR